MALAAAKAVALYDVAPNIPHHDLIEKYLAPSGPLRDLVQEFAFNEGGLATKLEKRFPSFIAFQWWKGSHSQSAH